ncbi:MAG TPA: hypothetical protein PLK94_00645 [Alphaproteobacteria bacterium]|nr:hypothetical protein [Alphaproteobacteria bacterium]HOO49774.1 hypothetical protein [Alphaproteobacteria bacterium]
MAIVCKNLSDFKDVHDLLLDIDGTFYSLRDIGYRIECYLRVFQKSAVQGLGTGLLNPVNLITSAQALMSGLHSDDVFLSGSSVQRLVHSSRGALTHQWTKTDPHLRTALDSLKLIDPTVRVSLFTDGCIDQLERVVRRADIDEHLSAERIADVRLRNEGENRPFKRSSYVFPLLKGEGMISSDFRRSCLIDDKLPNLENAHRFGVKTIWINSVLNGNSLPSGVDAKTTSVSEAIGLIAQSKRYSDGQGATLSL